MLTFMLINNLNGPISLGLSPKDTMSMISKIYLKCVLIRPKDTFPLCVNPSQLGPGEADCNLDVVNI